MNTGSGDSRGRDSLDALAAHPVRARTGRAARRQSEGAAKKKNQKSDFHEVFAVSKLKQL
jgi:hypothetical protein